MADVVYSSDLDDKKVIQALQNIDKNVEKIANKGEKDFNRLEKSANKLAKTLAAGFLGKQALDRLVAFGKESVRLANIQAEAEAQLAAAIKSTGGAAGLTARQMKELASELQGLTNFGDEATIQAEALLLTFTNISGDVFPRTVKAILDVSTAMKQDLKTSTIQVGKALNDPKEGLTALRRVGIQFTDAQERMIDKMLETNDLAGAQAVILAELERQFGGSAEAAREATGETVALSNAFGDLKEQVGSLLKDLDQATGTTGELTGIVEALTNALRGTRAELGFGSIEDEIAGLEQEIKGLKSARDELASGGGPLTSKLLDALGLWIRPKT